MALRPSVPTWRKYLLAPIWLPLALLREAARIIGGYGLGGLAGAFAWMHRGCKVHVWWVLQQAVRWVVGLPTWTPDDLFAFRVQPRTKAQRSRADADPRLARVVCECDNKRCAAREGMYVPALPPPAVLSEVERTMSDLLQRLGGLAKAELERVEVARKPPENPPAPPAPGE